MKNILGILLAAVFAGLSLLHFYWAAGGRAAGSAAIPSVGGKPVFKPSPLLTIVVATALLTAMVVVLGQIGWFGETVPQWIFRWGTWGVAGAFLLRAIGDFRLVGFFKKIRDTEFARLDTRLFSPLCLMISITAFLLV